MKYMFESIYDKKMFCYDPMANIYITAEMVEKEKKN